jgi:hypothetical protein
MIKIYTVSEGFNSSGYVRVFNSFKKVIEFIDSVNVKSYDGDRYSLFGAPYNEKTGINLPYNIDSVVLTREHDNETIYHKFLIQCFDAETMEKAEIER